MMKLLRFLLFPFAVLYHLITSIRNSCYDAGIFSSTEFKLPVIVVGNLSVGGTGKTPQIEYLVRLLKDNYKIAVLSRGYGRKTKGFIELTKHHKAEEVGDEPLQFCKKFPEISVAVDANRVQGIQQLIELKKPEVVLLDDAFQHRKVKAGFYVLLTKYDELYTQDFLLPTGNLRESRRGAKRANVIVVTKCPPTLSKEKQEAIKKQMIIAPNQQVFFSYIDYVQTTKGVKEIPLDELASYEIFLITGIANPKPLLDLLNDKGGTIHHLKYPDHYNFEGHDIKKIQAKFEQSSAKKKIMLTTEKDYMRLANRMHALHYIEIETKFIDNQKKAFDKVITDYLA